MGFYRQWSVAKICNSKLISEQSKRLKETLKIIDNFSQNGDDFFLLGDINLNALNYNKTYSEKDNYGKQLHTMTQEFYNTMTKNKLVLLNNKIPTREKSILDQIITNKI